VVFLKSAEAKPPRTVIVSMSPPDYPSAWLRPRSACFRLARQNYRSAAANGGQLPDTPSSSSYPDGHIDYLAAQVGNVLADVFGTELVCRTVEILRQLHADVVRAWLRAPVA
jgi:hypothetical protein